MNIDKQRVCTIAAVISMLIASAAIVVLAFVVPFEPGAAAAMMLYGGQPVATAEAHRPRLEANDRAPAEIVVSHGADARPMADTCIGANARQACANPSVR